MKTIVFLIFLGLSAISNAQLLDTFSGHEFEVQHSGKVFNKVQVDAIILGNRDKKLQLQNMLNGTGAELFWRTNGTLEEIYKAIEGSNVSWMWAQATPGKVGLTVTLNPDGFGHIELYEGQSLVGHILCQSSATRNVEGGQPNEGKTKVWTKDADYENGKGVKMPNAIFIDKPGRKLAIHAGNLLTKSGGCVRIGIFSSKQLFRLINEGAEVTVVWN